MLAILRDLSGDDSRDDNKQSDNHNDEEYASLGRQTSSREKRDFS